LTCRCCQDTQAEVNALAPSSGEGPVDDVPQNAQDLTIFVRLASTGFERAAPLGHTL
jgi:hypothetical protein